MNSDNNDGITDHIVDYQPISSKEEADFRRLLAKSELKIGEAEKYAKVLNEQLLQLDGANIESIMDNEQAVTDLINLIDQALDEATHLEEQLDTFDGMLSDVRDSVELIEEKDSLGTVERNNTAKLLKELEAFVGAIDLVSEEHIMVLQRPNLSDPSSVVFPLFVMLSKRARANQDASSFFSVMILGRLLVLMKRQFDMLMEKEARLLEGSRMTKRVRVGILDTIQRFEGLARCAEKAFSGGSERRNELDRWYGELLNSVIKGIEYAATSSYSKSPASVVRLENYHALYSKLSELKIECLDAKRKDAKKQHQDNIQVYVKEYMGRPLEKIHYFFENVQGAIDSGVKPDEISYQSAFTRDELKKVLSSYPGKEVKKGLEMLYEKVEKHLVDQSPLLQVVWTHMQDEFLKQLKHYKQVIGQCYPNQRVDLEVSINEVLQFFSEIAQQH
ncbi:hypothetical protein QR680_002096 [Steinernema hermaphroditum]|uniref:Exocyst complex component Sec3 C-terminal domain-containing protein n=1 Tax=Steinernema hermaphroditum TaxID=289476 RepID=A0AA39H183_9BILA|nr:hypothetical protein QR680_002096 [Steinernema hermaphroditum]